MTLQARAIVAFPAIDSFIDRIVQSLVGHDIAVTQDGADRTAHFAGGTCRLRVEAGRLVLLAEGIDATALNVAKHGVTSLVQFVAATEKPAITWTGDDVDATVPPDLRELRVECITDLSPRMRRFTLRGDNLGHWADDRHLHCRLLFQPAGVAQPEWPMIGPDGQILWPQGDRRLLSRIYTIRHIDVAAGLLDIDFVLHDGTSPGCDWARRARAGAVVGMIGRGAMGPRPADWYLLAGDETGLPGIARILEGLPDTAHGVALIEVADAAEELALRCPPGIELRWLHRDGARPGTTTLIIDAVRAIPWPAQGSVFAWGGCEHAAFRALRDHLRRGRGLPREATVNYPHWRRGMSEEDIVSTGGEAVD
jgi:NADPH-dependent ferric siderophore reductase